MFYFTKNFVISLLVSKKKIKSLFYIRVRAKNIFPFYYSRSKSLEDYNSTLENNLKVKNTDIGMLESEIGILKADKAQTQSEMNAVNQVGSKL